MLDAPLEKLAGYALFLVHAGVGRIPPRFGVVRMGQFETLMGARNAGLEQVMNNDSNPARCSFAPSLTGLNAP